ncbi:MAG: DUF4397 domain-containing protein [Kofleriaceae bacterium]|nr:DUF4397 domain-containing protein [Kofleriaceae bacterium]MCL4225392.1 DUF4397 domain-containing protein [Myxococcales bacterium]
MRPTRFAIPLTLAFAAPLAACGDDDATDPQPDTARLRVVHASPDAPAVDIYAQGVATPLVTNLAYGQVTPYLELDEGTYTLELRAAGATGAPAFTTGPLWVGDDKAYTAVAAGFLASTADADRFRVLALEEGFTAPGADQVAVRVVHAAADAPTVGIDVGADDPANPEVPSLARFADTGAAGIALPAGQPLRIGIAAGGATVTSFSAPALPGGAELFVIAIGRLGDLPRQPTGFSLAAIGDAGLVGILAQDPTVYALHASPDAPDVDVRVAANDALLIGDLGYGELRGVQVPPGSYELDFYAAGSAPGTPAASAQVPGLAAGQRYLAVATGFLAPGSGEPGFQLIAVADELAIDASGARLGAIHASPDAPAVDIATATGQVMDSPALVAGLAFGAAAAGAGLEVPAASLRVGVAAAGQSTAVATFDVTTVDGLRAFAVATGALAPAAGRQPFRLTIVDTSASPWTATAIAPNP